MRALRDDDHNSLAVFPGMYVPPIGTPLYKITAPAESRAFAHTLCQPVPLLESPHPVHILPILPLHPPQRMLARTGEWLKLSVPLMLDGQCQSKLEVRLVSGWPLPKFIRANADGARGVKDSNFKEERRVVNLWGAHGRRRVLRRGIWREEACGLGHRGGW